MVNLIAGCCYDSKLINKLKTSHIQSITIVFPTEGIIGEPGKLIISSVF